MKPIVRTVLPILLSLSAAALLFLAIDRLLERKHMNDEIGRLRAELFRARAAAGRCQGSIVNSEARLREFDYVLDSLRARVDSFEALDRRGVPQARYPEYLETFESYNDSVAAWEGRARRLRAVEAACRTTILEHNALSDTLQAVLAAAGVIPTADDHGAAETQPSAVP